MLWTWILLVTFADGEEIRLGYHTREVCEEVRRTYVVRPEVIAVSECRSLD